ncbi:MAG: T9SS type A sorting domain-containing protein [Bacteroidota bacterium]
MKKSLLSIAFVFAFFLANAQCTTTNATSCQCANQTSTNCDLLPDITISWYAILNYMGGPNEYAQVCSPPCSGNDGRLRLTGSTPNIGYGPLTVRGSSLYVCGTDTFTSDPSPCPDGSNARQIIKQRIYHKNGNAMTYWDRNAGSMTYHPSHGHNHVDDWGVFTLRYQTSDPDPRNWPIVATGAKLGFCLMDYYRCSDASANHHCKDTNTVYNQGTTLNNNNNFPNYNLGGGAYNCSVVEQGISSGWTDVYSESLDLMWINIPAGTCNGQYWIVIEVDPNNNFLESDETNNYTAVPYTLTQQDAPGNPVSSITTNLPSPKICPGQNIILKANAAMSYSWSTGATTQSITVSTPGSYSCQTVTHCGTSSASITVTMAPAPGSPVVTGDTVCINGIATLTATGTGMQIWEDGSGNPLDTGATFNTPNLSASTTYYVRSEDVFTDTTWLGPKNYSYGVSATSTSNNYLNFTAYDNFKLISVDVFAAANGTRVIELRDSANALLQTTTATLTAGMNTVTLNWNIAPGMAYRLVGAGGVGLYRNNSNATNYPYTLDGVVDITGSSQGPAYYYYFYNWKVETQNRTCSSALVPVLAYVDNCTAVTPGKDLSNAISVFPNPSSGTFNVSVALPGVANMKIEVTDMLGKVVYSEQLSGLSGSYQHALDLSGLAKGTYMLNVNVADKPNFKRIVIQ